MSFTASSNGRWGGVWIPNATITAEREEKVALEKAKQKETKATKEDVADKASMHEEIVKSGAHGIASLQGSRNWEAA